MANSIDISKIVTSVGGGSSSDPVDEAGDVIQYQMTVTNTGDGPLTGIVVTDPLLGGTISQTDDGDGDAVLAPGEIWIYTGSYTVDQQDIDDDGIDQNGDPTGNGLIFNAARVDTTEGVFGTSSAFVEIDYNPDIEFDKQIISMDPGGNGQLDQAGDEINYSFKVTNVGNVTLENVTVVDPLTGLNTPIGDLAPGESQTVFDTYAITQDDLNNRGGGDGDIDNTATADSDQTDPVQDSESAPLVYDPDLQITKTAVEIDTAGDGKLNNPGETVVYDIEVKNTGNIDLTNIVTNDPLLGGILNNGSVSGDNVDPGVLNVGEIWTYTASYDITQDDLDGAGNNNGSDEIDNTVTTDTDQTDPKQATETVPLDVDPDIDLVKTVFKVDEAGNGILDTAGDLIEYKVTVTNTGNQTLTNVQVTDPLTGMNEMIASLAPGASQTFDTQYAITQNDLDTNGGGDGDIDNTATADSDQAGPEDDSTSTPLATPGLDIVKIITAVDDGSEPTGDGNGKLDVVGDVVEYEVTVENTGGITLTNVTVKDPLTGLDEVIPSLDPGDTASFDTKYTITQADLDGGGNVGGDGYLDNTAVADSDQTDEVDDSKRVPVEEPEKPEEPNDCIRLSEQEAWALIAGTGWLGGTPNSDNGVLTDPINKGKALGGDDTLRGNGNDNTIIGNSGDDFLRGDGGDDYLFGNWGNDILLGDEPITDPNNPPAQGNDELTGGSGNDTLAGGGGNDKMAGDEHKDFMIGGAGDDCMEGGSDRDFMLGGSGNDIMHGDGDNDCMAGQAGEDVMYGGDGNDMMSGGTGDDVLRGEDGDDILAGNEGDDYINGGLGNDRMWGGSGTDTIRGFDGDDQISGGLGDDILIGQRGDDLIFGDDGHDYLQGGGGNDRLDGGDGNDFLEGSDNADCIRGGAGDDTIYGDNLDGQPAVGEASDLISGGGGADTIYAGQDDDQVKGGGGADVIHGQEGDDCLAGNGGRDTINGGTGNDQIQGNNGKDTLNGDEGNDVMDGGNGSDTLNGGTGDDCLDGGSKSDTLNGDEGNDTLDGGSGNDELDGGDGDDFLYGNGGKDVLYGDMGQETGGEDTLLGGGGNDELHGGKWTDCLIADAGNDVMWGEGDGDDFVFGHDVDKNRDGDCDDDGEEYTGQSIGNNVIKDFDDDQQDRIIFHNWFDGKLNAEIIGDDVKINTPAGSVLIEGLVSELEGLQEAASDPFFDEAALLKFLIDGSEDGDLKGVVSFDDKCVELPDCDPKDPVVGWGGRLTDPPDCCKILSEEKIGNTTINATEKQIADLYVEQDANVTIDGVEICIDLLAEGIS